MTYKLYLSKLLTVSCLAVLIFEQVAAAATVSPTPSLVVSLQPDVFITEVRTATSSSASEEFVEFFNNTDHDMDFADTAHGGKDIWKLQYFSGSKLSDSGVTDWTKPTGSIDLSTMSNHTIPAHDYYLLAATKSDGTIYQPGGIEADGHYSAKLSDDIGLQLVDVLSSTAVTTAHDRLLWRKTPSSSASYQAPAVGSSLQRLPNDDDEYIDTEGKLTSFASKANITPKDLWLSPVIDDPSEVDEADPAAGTSDDPLTTPVTTTTTPVASDGLKHPVITELLPNPATPQTDANDEFIELYNPNAISFDLSGYTLETGVTTLHDFTFAPQTSLAANSYQAFYSSDTHLSLSNTGGQVRLFDSKKALIDSSDSYPSAADGQAWALLDDKWQWSALPTPNEANVFKLSTATAQPGTTTKTTKAKVKGVNTTKSATKKVAKVKVKKAKASKAKKKTKKAKKLKTSAAVSNLASVVKPTPIHTGVLAAVAVAAVLYAMYEYRIDLANYLYRLRSNRAARRKPRR